MQVRGKSLAVDSGRGSGPAIDSITKIAFGSGIICYNSCCQCKLKLCHAVSQLAGAQPLGDSRPAAVPASSSSSSSSRFRLGSFNRSSSRANKFPLLVSLTFLFRCFSHIFFNFIFYVAAIVAQRNKKC